MKYLCALFALASFGSLLTFGQDSTPPQVVSTASADGLIVGVCFNEALDPTTAADPTLYSLNGSATVDAALLEADGMTVALYVSGLPGSYTLTVNGVTDLSGNGVNATIDGQVLGFTSQDLGFVEEAGRAVACAPGSVDVYARGLDIWGFTDSGHFIWKEYTGDFDVRVRLESFVAPAGSANAGLMIRESAYEGSRNVQLVTYANQRLWVSAQRVDNDGTSTVTPGDWDIAWPENANYPNIWLRLKRVGNSITTYGGTDGLTWIQVGDTVTPATPYPDTVLVGMRTTPVEVQVAGSHALAKYRDYGDFVITDGTLTISQQPSPQNVFENQTATFSVSAEVTGASASEINYQWLRDGVEIAGATSATYTTPLLLEADTGARYRVRLSLPGGSITALSDEVELTVVRDITAPTLVSTASLDGFTIGVCFNEALDPATASDPSNYTVSGGASVNNAILEADGVTVSLTVSGLTGTTFTVTVNGVADLAGNVVNASSPGDILGFSQMDLGIVEGPGRAISCAPGSVDVWARGLDIWGFADSGHLVWKEQTGDFDVRVRMESFEAPAPDANAGLMARENAEPGSRNVSVVVYANQRNWTATQRAEQDGNSSVLPGNWRIDWPEGEGYPQVWLRLKRAGQTFTTYGSINGDDWTQIGDSVTPAVPYPDTLLLGLRTTPVEVEVAGSTAYAQYREYGDYVIDDASINITQQPASLTVLENAPASFTVTAEAGGTSSSNLSYQWQRNGENIPGAVSATYQIPAASSSDSNARFSVVVSLPGGISLTSEEATLTVTEDVVAPKVISGAGLKTSIGLRFDEQLDPGTASDPSLYTLPGGGSVLSATLQPDGRSVVLEVSELSGSEFTVNVNGVRDIESNPTVNTTFTGQIQTLNAGDLGLVDAPGTVMSFAPGSFDVTARGDDIWGFADSGHFIWEERTGDFDVRVRIESFAAPSFSANAGLMVRETLDAGSRNVQVVTYANQRLWVGAQRAETDGSSVVLAGDWDVAWPEAAAYPNIWVRIKRTGDTITTYGSVDGQNWIQVGDAVTPEIPYPDTVLVGMRTTPVEVQINDSTAVALYRDYGDFEESATAPELSIAFTSNNQITISWPTSSSSEFTLESADSLPGTWEAVQTVPQVEGDLSVVTIPVESNTDRFFRLAQGNP